MTYMGWLFRAYDAGLVCHSANMHHVSETDTLKRQIWGG